jgi:hypothetical protein
MSIDRQWSHTVHSIVRSHSAALHVLEIAPSGLALHFLITAQELILTYTIQVVSFGLQGVSDDLHTKNPQALQFVQNSLQKYGTLHAVVEKAANSDRMDLLLYAQDDDQPKQLINRILLNEIVAKYLKPDLPLVSFVK